MKFKSFSAHILAQKYLAHGQARSGPVGPVGMEQGRGQKLYHGRGSGKTEKLRFYRKIPHGL